ncbi:hypothetical protein L486_00570 [Kwoniella mangroviensis CBS 10435]|uniref:Ricin B lectin domain-containing protein n=1 Tax=Kwoniella mangroviensis CBS 10435 TaxID=1331196 RepID=A0A1B9IZH2_9TREE|nr:hypothetical protein L486_00570 [Kwoniella mangroviensis CBS 10435]
MLNTMTIALLPILLGPVISASVIPISTRQFSDPDPGPAVKIQPISYDNLCLTVIGPKLVPGAAVELATCFDSSDSNVNHQQWHGWSDDPNQQFTLSIQDGDNRYCLDKGENPNGDGDSQEFNGTKLKLSQCDNGVPNSQLWGFDQGNNQLKFVDIFAPNTDSKKRCLDVVEDSHSYQPDGLEFAVQKNVQLWECVDGNTNQPLPQIWRSTDA